MLQKLGTFFWIPVVAAFSFPIGAGLHDIVASLWVPTAGGQLRFSLLYAVLALGVGLFLGRRLAAAQGKQFLRITLIWIAVSISTWIALVYLGTGDAPQPRTLAVGVAAAHFVLSFGAFIIQRRWVRYPLALLAAIGVAITAFSPAIWTIELPAVATIGDVSDLGTYIAAVAAEGRAVIALLIGAAIVSYGILRIKIARAPGIWSRAYHSLVWIALTHGVWLAALFVTGTLGSMPRWLPFATVVAILAVGVLWPLFLTRLKGELEFGSLIYQPTQKDNATAWAQLERGTRKAARRAWVISYTGVSNEPRVLRQCEALVDNGWEVIVCGFDGHSPRPPAWNFVRLPTTDPFRWWFRELLKHANKWALRATVHGKPRGLLKWTQHVAHGTNPLWLQIRLQVMRVARTNRDLRPDMVISHDYHTADVGYALAKEFGAKFSIDCHEYAVMQYSNDPNWVRYSQPVIRTVQDYYLRRADLVTAVGEGIAGLISAETPLRRPPIVIRNVPFRNRQDYRPTGKRLKVLYHGDLSRPREIDMAIRSMPLWREDFDFILRGSGDPAYIGELKRMVERLGLQKRVFFEPPVPFDQIVPSANGADIGYFAYRAYSPQIQYALPNKFFEYVMAGLAICVSDLKEVGALVREHGNGMLIPQHTPESIAETINSFTRESIERCKKASVAAADKLNWEVERVALVTGYESMWTNQLSNVTVLRKNKKKDAALAESMRGAQFGVAR